MHIKRSWGERHKERMPETGTMCVEREQQHRLARTTDSNGNKKMLV